MTAQRTVGHLTNRAARLFRQLADQRLAPFGLSSGHLPVLTALIADAALSQKALTERAAIEQPTMAATLARMERDGIIERRPDPADGRSSLFSLAPAIRSQAASVQKAIDDLNTDAFAGLPVEDRQRSRRLLELMVASLEGALSAPDRDAQRAADLSG